MGGRAGQKQRKRTGPGGQFDSIGDQSQQSANLALVTKLIGEIGRDGEAMVGSANDRIFLQDCRIKMNQNGGMAAFGWRQVEAVVRIHREVAHRREVEANDGQE